MSTGANALSLVALSKDYGSRDGGAGAPAVDRLTLTVEPGTILGLLGPSGCGKTTTLRMIAGLVAPSSGRVLVGDQDVSELPASARKMGVVFQSYALFPHMTVARNVGFGLKVRGVPAEEAARRISEAIGLVRLTGLEARRPRQLSGGQQQRVALARALVIAPEILLLDEPLSNLDAKLREEMRNEIRDIQRRLGITTVFVTHDQAEAMALSDRIAILDQGRLAQIGGPEEIYDRPANAFVARFVGRVNEIAAAIVRDESRLSLRLADGQRLPSPEGLSREGPVIAMVRPHLITATPADVGGQRDGALIGMIERRTFIGDLVELTVAVGSVRLVVEARPGRDAAAGLAVGSSVGLSWQPRHTLVFAP